MDIEDLSFDGISHNKTNANSVKARIRTKKLRDTGELSVSSDIPEKYHVFVQTWGCTHNTSDSEYMAGLLAKYGYKVTLGGVQIITDNSDCKCNKTSEQCCSSKENSDSTVESIDDLARKQAHVWLLNSCTVKGPAEDHFRNAILNALKLGKHVVVAGCVPQSRPNADYLKNVSMVGVQQIDRVVEVVDETLQGNVVRFLEKKYSTTDFNTNDDSYDVDRVESKKRMAGPSLDLPKIRRNQLIEILAISTGCLNACTYCKTKHARGVLVSYPIEQLLDRAKQAFEEGVKELWLTSEDLGAYGRDLARKQSKYACPSLTTKWPEHLTLADLLAGLVPLIPAGCMMRLGMTNPPYILDQLEEIAEVLSHPRVFSFIHIPVQSASDGVLDAMRREYTIEEFSTVVDYLMENVKQLDLPPNSPPTSSGCGKLTIATDIICGFPNETDNDFQQTVSLIERYRFPVLFINQFFARPGTPAANMTRKANTSEVKERTRCLHNLFRTYQPYAGRVGCQARVLITEQSSDGKYWVGHTKAYEQILLPKLPELYGRIVLTRIVQWSKFYMLGEVIDPGPFDALVDLTADANQSAHMKLHTLDPLVEVMNETTTVKQCISDYMIRLLDYYKSNQMVWIALSLGAIYVTMKFTATNFRIFKL